MRPETLRKHVLQVEADSGKRPDLVSSQEREGIPRRRKENYELRRANEILKSASVSFAGVGARPGTCAKRRPPRRRTSQGARVFCGWRSA
jgi:transposase